MTRLRPVLMTTAATVFGHMPLVFVTGAGAEARNSIGIMLVTGMTIGTLFTLFILPAVYMLFAADHRPERARDLRARAARAATAFAFDDRPPPLRADSGRYVTPF